MPPGSRDAHCHIFGPFDRYPLPDNRSFTPALAPETALRRMHDQLGFDRAVIVQSQGHGLDHRPLLDALATGNPNMVFKWRRQYRAGLLSKGGSEKTVLLPVALPPDPSADVATLSAPTRQSTEPVRELAVASGIEIELNGARVRVTGKVDPLQLRLVLRCLMPA